MKNNAPSAVILSPEEYERLAEIEENYRLLLLAQERIANGSMEHTVSFNDTMEKLVSLRLTLKKRRTWKSNELSNKLSS